jgi:23S rRNA pseudouridine1911/1915/1917 synthase
MPPLRIAETLTLAVPEGPPRERLDVHLASRLRDMTRSYIARLIRRGLATVDGRRVKTGYLLAGGETVTVQVPEPESLAIVPEEAALSILYEDGAIVAVDKPAGMPVHPSWGHAKGTLVAALLWRGISLPDSLEDDEDKSMQSGVRPGVVHRLDIDTTGVVAVAKTAAAHRELARQFHDREVAKTYYAICRGRPRRDSGVVDLPLARHAGEERKIKVRKRDGREAVTNYFTEETWPGFCLIRAEPKTGRTHQVRVHLASLGTPVIADPLYGRESAVTEEMLMAPRGRRGEAGGGGRTLIARQALHAARLEVTHPETGRRLVLEAPIPADMAAVLAALRGG